MPAPDKLLATKLTRINPFISRKGVIEVRSIPNPSRNDPKLK